MNLISRLSNILTLIFIALSNLIYNLSLDIYEILFFLNKNFLTYIYIKIHFFLHYINFNPYSYSITILDSDKNLDYTYGETPYITIYHLLKNYIDKNTIYIDLGCGRGKTIFFTAKYFKNKLSIGIDIGKKYIEKAKKLKIKINLENTLFLNENFLNHNFKQYKEKLIIFITATLFTKKTMEKLITKLIDIKKDSIIILLSYKIIDKKHFILIEKVKYPFSWGLNTIYVYKKI